MRLWLVKALLQGTFGGQADNILHVCKTAMDASGSDLFPSGEIESRLGADTTRSMQVDTTAVLERANYRSPASYIVLSMAYGNSVNFVPQMDGNVPEQDHIFSRDELSLAGVEEDLINNVANIRLVERSPNRIKSNTLGETWLQGLKPDERERHLIPEGKWALPQFGGFLKARRTLIAQKFKPYVNS